MLGKLGEGLGYLRVGRGLVVGRGRVDGLEPDVNYGVSDLEDKVVHCM